MDMRAKRQLYETDEEQRNSPVPQRSPNPSAFVMSLGIKPGARIQIRAEGTDEYEALQGIEEFLKRNELTK
ncbi:hypothetical protein AXI59_01485 [Bacillus nakamurai]|uniref:HPr family phosphocarrier protein n=1 Tax=Bacillus nakamurai TaxID=1793963 RepID=UPI0007782F57|nr:HPr family phosphocarrier protein [Bacillus nakamurai]KXZ16589.1 hypothetical protein AXI59_01485 [Bacillus nakamurai]